MILHKAGFSLACGNAKSDKTHIIAKQSVYLTLLWFEHVLLNKMPFYVMCYSLTLNFWEIMQIKLEGRESMNEIFK